MVYLQEIDEEYLIQLAESVVREEKIFETFSG